MGRDGPEKEGRPRPFQPLHPGALPQQPRAEVRFCRREHAQLRERKPHQREGVRVEELSQLLRSQQPEDIPV